MLVCTIDTVLDQKAEFKATWKGKEVAYCCITWFEAQNTVHVWFSAPSVHSKHAVTTFQKFQKGSHFDEVYNHYFELFQQLVCLLMPVVQGHCSLEMLPFRWHSDRVHPCVAAILKCLVQVKKNVQRGGKTKHEWKCRWDTHCGSGQKTTRGWDRVDECNPGATTSQ